MEFFVYRTSSAAGCRTHLCPAQSDKTRPRPIPTPQEKGWLAVKREVRQTPPVVSATSPELSIVHLGPTVFLRSAGETLLEQQASLQVTCDIASVGLVSHARAEGRTVTTVLEGLPAGESTHAIYVPELSRDGTLVVEIRDGEQSLAHHSLAWRKPRRWTVHVVQLSHHDAGYTDLKSSVLDLHKGYLCDVLEMADETRDFPEAAQFRMTIEQTWSIHHFLNRASSAQVDRMISLMRSGHIELTALFGNMVTHLCGHESLTRALYHAFALKRDHGIPIVSAQHNDVPGFAWGLASVLTEAGIKLFVPALPYFWSWTEKPYNSFWDQDAIFPMDAPGAFWWEAPSGKRVLFWSNNIGCNGDRHGSFKGLGERLQHWSDEGFIMDTVRWPVCGGFADNSPYLASFAHGVKRWNETWTYPQLISSTNAGFYEDLVKEDISHLPVIRGELPEADFPVGALSTSRATAASRGNHSSIPSAERIATTAAQVTPYEYPAQTIARAYEDTLWFDEHTWGFHLPCGPAVEAAKLEKAVHAHRAEALTHDVLSKAMASIADRVAQAEEGVHLVVFNSLPFARSCPVSTPLRGLDNCASDCNLVEDAETGDPIYFIVALKDRAHVRPSDEMRSGQFELMDTATGETVPFQMATIESSDDPVPYAAERLGVGSGEKRLGFIEDSGGLRQDLKFVAKDVPACGYKTYRIKPTDKPVTADATMSTSGSAIENQFYRVEVDQGTGRVVSIFDKSGGRELMDSGARHTFGTFVVRDPASATLDQLEDVRVSIEHHGTVSVSIVCRGRIHGHPAVTHSFTLHDDQKRIDYAIRILKDATPLLDAHTAFPFKVEDPTFRYEGVLSCLAPIEDYLPGAYSDNIPIQNWVKVTDGRFSILWSSLDSPVVSLGDLWPGYVSPAHRSIIGDALQNEPLKTEDLRNGWIYSNLFNNNFGTNFAATQAGDFLFRYVFTTREGTVEDSEAVAFGFDAVTPLEAMFTPPGPGTLPTSNSFLEIENPGVALLTWKKAEDGHGWILRLWNTGETRALARVRMPGLRLLSAKPVNLVEEEVEGEVQLTPGGLDVEIAARSVQTVRCEHEAERPL